MKKIVTLMCVCCICSISAYSQDTTLKLMDTTVVRDLSPAPAMHPHYSVRLAVDGPIILPSVVWSIYAFPKIYSKPNIDSAIVASLNKNDIPAFDRWAVRYSDKADQLSNYAFYGSIPYPFVLLFDRKIRQDAGTVGELYLEAMSITGLLYTSGDYFIDRYRPETYDQDKPFGDRLSGNEKNAFFAGHVALVGTATFFAASIYDEYHPASNWKWAFYGIATAATGATIYLRHAAGKHFPSDLLVGSIVGVGSGMLVPRLHRYKPGRKQAWHFTPSVGEGYGMTATYKF